jgi:hypothetical protein
MSVAARGLLSPLRVAEVKTNSPGKLLSWSERFLGLGDALFKRQCSLWVKHVRLD